tara:strand:- start:21792 stop:22634 length:843 start_codon:yes stop_codon:yes gene_type:complete
MSMKQKQYEVKVGSVTFCNRSPFVLIAGPCVIESKQQALEVAEYIDRITKKLDIPFIYKSSFDKANRSSSSSPRGVGMVEGLEILSEIKEKYCCPVTTDIHDISHCAPVSEHVDILQIPAFLCRQTDLLVSAAKTGKAINVKKGQFLAPWDMQNIIDKIISAGNYNILLCERGTSFGYNNLISDMRSLPILAESGFPVIYDATHSVQQPGGMGLTSGGQREFVPFLARAAVSIGVAGIFIETHPDPDRALSDGPNMVPLCELDSLLDNLLAFDGLVKVNK